MNSIYNHSVKEWDLLAKKEHQQFQVKLQILKSLPNKRANIAGYLIGKVNPKTNIFNFTIIDLAKRFNCSKQTVRAGIHLLDNVPTLIVTNHFIRYKDYHPVSSKEGGVYND